MKKFTFALMALLAFSFSLKAQQYVSTEPANRNVILEEFTGRGCPYCPDGHRIANSILASNPGRVFMVGYHSVSSLSPTASPNLNTTIAGVIDAAFGNQYLPMAVVNRSTSGTLQRGQWASYTNQQLAQAAECNVGGMVVLNPVTRTANITVEVYYTGNSSADENYLTIAMTQDSIMGAQSGSSDNPSQIIGNSYCHLHTFRDMVTPTWGDAFSPTTQGTLITRTYQYQIPEIVGDPNGVPVNLNNIHFLAWVSERYQGSPTRPILNGCELETVQGAEEPIYPFIKNVAQEVEATCTHTKMVDVTIQNGGTETLTSMKINAVLEGETFSVDWEGELESYSVTHVQLPVEVPFGNHAVTVNIIEANGEPFNGSGTGTINCLEWADLNIEGEEEELRLEVMQDRYGAQITWEFTTSDGTVLAQGGPYANLASATATQLQIAHATVPANECVTFTIHDGGQNGICCSYGHGYYIVKDSQGNVLFGDVDNGQFGASATHLISVKGPQPQVEVGGTVVENVDYNHADFISSLVYEGYPDQVGFSCRKVTSVEPMIIPGILNEFGRIFGSTDELEHTSIYMVKAFAVVNGETYYGAETTFQTWTESVAQLEQSLKIYPNPTTDVLNIQGVGMTSIEVYNTMGQRVMTQPVDGNGIQLDTESLNNGIYFLRIMANDGNVLNRTFSVAR